MSWNFLGNYLFSSIWIFVGLTLAGLLYKFMSNTNKLNSEKDVRFAFTIGIIAIVELTFSVGFVVLGIYKAFYSIHHSTEAAAELTGVVATVATIISTVFGLLFKNKQDKIQKLHSESGWRGRLLDLEKKPFYTTNDLLELNSFINPYHKKNDDLDYLINSAITTILNNIYLHKNELHEFDSFYKDVKNSKVSNWIKEIFSNEKKYDNIFKFEENIDIKKEEINTDIFKKEKDIYYLNKHEAAIIRKCIHALLKNDWIKVTR